MGGSNATMTLATILLASTGCAMSAASDPSAATKALLMSTGLFGTMPRQMYSDLTSRVCTTPGASVRLLWAEPPLTRARFERLCDDLDVDRLPLVAHSSLDASLLTSRRLERALLIDPAVAPVLGVGGPAPAHVRPRAPVRVVHTKLYERFVPRALRPSIESATTSALLVGGHSDVLDAPWARVASLAGIASDAGGREALRAELSRLIVAWLREPVPT